MPFNVFKLADAYERRNRSGPGNAELLQRASYMEKIITHYAGSVSLDTESLKAMAESIDNKNFDAHQVKRQAPIMDSPGSDFLGAEDENYTVQPLDNNTTRKTDYWYSIYTSN
jgi:hypothetical protein